VSGEQELEAYEERAVGEGYEGIMVRVPDSQYFAGRSHALLKLKRFDDAEFTLVDLQEGVGNRGGLATRAFLRMPNGQGTFAAGVVGDDATTAAMLTNKSKYIGKLWTVKYKGLTSAGIPRHAKLMRQRID
jgi:DNA ligase-1